MEYLIHRIQGNAPSLEAPWDDPVWQQAQTGLIRDFWRTAPVDPAKSFEPQVEFRTLHDDQGIYGIFRVQDHYVRSVAQKDQDGVCRDSCVEFFVKPATGNGYFNFEFSCGGVMLSSFIVDYTRTPKGFGEFYPLKDEECAMVKRFASLPRINEPEKVGDCTWTLSFFVPFALLQRYSGGANPAPGELWHANFYKCGDATSHPHWGMWKPVPTLNFHQPDFFGKVIFE